MANAVFLLLLPPYRCTMYIASKQPPWSAVPNWWELDGTQPQPDGAYIGLVGM
jgi:hypothetical protein